MHKDNPSHMVKNQPCPCGTKQNYQQCCMPYHNGKVATTAECLMRSRYSAFHLGLLDYLKKTWDSKTLPKNLNLDAQIKWIRLKIVNTKTLNTKQATVHFIATYKEAGKAYKLEENSLFELKNKVWYYREGVALD